MLHRALMSFLFVALVAIGARSAHAQTLTFDPPDLQVDAGDVVMLRIDHERCPAIVEDRRASGADRFVVRGTLLADNGAFIAAISGDARVVSVQRRDRETIYRQHAGSPQLVRADAVDFPPCGADRGPIPELPPTTSGTPGACDDGSVVDLLVVYTPLAEQAAGGMNALVAEIDLAVALANQAYADSLIPLTLELVALNEVTYNEVGTYLQHLDRLLDPDDGVMDDVHSLRSSVGADVVSLIVADTELCGTTFTMQTLSHDFESLALNVVTLACAAGNRSLAHEIGHTMGCGHDRQDDDNAGLLDFSHGHRFQGDTGLWRTVMATLPGTRIGHFSNPDVIFDGAPTGIPDGDPESADNAETIRQSAFTVANFRCDPALCSGARGGPIEDCNTNGLPDDCDIDLGYSEDVNLDGVPDECQVPLEDVCTAGVLIIDVGVEPFDSTTALTNGEPDPDCGAFERDVWFRYGSTCSGYVVAEVCDSSFDTQMAVYSQCPEEGIDRLACGDDECGAQSRVIFYVDPGLYRVRIGSPDGVGGTGLLAIACAPGPPCPGDADLDGVIGVLDLLGLLGVWGTADPVFDIAPDGGDGMIDVLDLLELLGSWGQCF